MASHGDPIRMLDTFTMKATYYTKPIYYMKTTYYIKHKPVNVFVMPAFFHIKRPHFFKQAHKRLCHARRGFFGGAWTARLSIFDGRVVKSRGPWNLPALPAMPPEVSQLPQLRATHPHAPGARITGVKQTPSNQLADNSPGTAPTRNTRTFRTFSIK